MNLTRLHGTPFVLKERGRFPNPGGRPKGSKSWPSLLEEVGRERISIVERGKPRRITKKRAVVKRAYHHALVNDDLSYLAALGAFKEVEVETRLVPLEFTLKLEEDSPPPNDGSDDDYDYSQPQLKGPGSKDPE